jgi:hypothetical protein
MTRSWRSASKRHTLQGTPRPQLAKVFASFFKKKFFFALFFFEKKNQKTFASPEAHPSARAALA